jgi:polyphenol oxidase
VPSKKQSIRARTVGGRRSVAGIAKPEILKAEELNAFPWLVHGFSTRPHGHSTIYGGEDLNLGFNASDTKKNVERNRASFQNALLGRKANLDLVTLSQIHSDIVYALDGAPDRALRGDGLITRTPGLLLAMQVADCVPVIVVDPEQQAIGAFHAGWRGTVKRIVEKGVGTMRMRYDADPAQMQAVIGPCIHQCCYSVGDEVVEQFESQFAYADTLFREVYDKDPIKERYPLLFLTARAPGHFNINNSTHLDLVEANRQQLLAAGLDADNIHIVSECTSCNKDYLWSHRGEDGFAGRMMGVIGIRPSLKAE